MRALFLGFGLLFALPAMAQHTMPVLSGNIAIHDPSVIVVDGTWVSFATGVENAPDGGTPRTKTSPDGVTWTETGALPGGLPQWIETELGYTPKNLWAPAISEQDGTYYLYYSASSFGRNDSLIGLMTNSGFDPARPTEGWVDLGMPIVRSHATDNFNAIDPFRIDSSGGRAFLAFGSFWDGLRMVELEPETGQQLDGAELIQIASRGGGAIEAPAILEHDARFYLFVSFDFCCRGIGSTYRIVVGRADAIEGPYLDADGKPMLEGGGTELLSATGNMRGPGGQEVFVVDGEPWLAFHYYGIAQGGQPRLQVAPLRWTEDDWPVLDAVPAD